MSSHSSLRAPCGNPISPLNIFVCTFFVKCVLGWSDFQLQDVVHDIGRESNATQTYRYFWASPECSLMTNSAFEITLKNWKNQWAYGLDQCSDEFVVFWLQYNCKSSLKYGSWECFQVVKRWDRSPELVFIFDWWLKRNVFLLKQKEILNFWIFEIPKMVETSEKIISRFFHFVEEGLSGQLGIHIPTGFRLNIALFARKWHDPRESKMLGKVSLSVPFESEKV